MPSSYEISTDPGRLDIDLIHGFLTSSYWATGRSREVVERSIRHSLCFGVYAEGRQIGFARVATDRAVFAYLMDVFVVPEHRGRGVGQSLIRAVLAHPDLQGLQLIALRTRDAHGLYARFGFVPIAEPGSMMAIQQTAEASAVLGVGRGRADDVAGNDSTYDVVVNDLGQIVGAPVASWTPPPHPPREPIEGRFCAVQPIDERFAADLFAADSGDVEGRTWTYLSYGPFDSESEYRLWLKETCSSPDPLFHAIVSRREGRAAGLAAYMRIAPSSGSIEVGGIHFSPLLQRTPAATEAMYLMMRRAFELGYRRYEWKCDALNTPSRIAAQRLGFSFEGTFRQATVYKGRSRDTAWYAVIDRDWPMLKQAFDTWLKAGNFDEAGRQRSSLTELTRPLLHRQG